VTKTTARSLENSLVIFNCNIKTNIILIINVRIQRDILKQKSSKHYIGFELLDIYFEI